MKPTIPYHLFLDDERRPKDVTWVRLPLVPWTIVRDHPSFVATITAAGVLPLHISFDHDLGADAYDEANRLAVEARLLTSKPQIDYSKLKTKTGYHCAQWLVDYCIAHDYAPLPEWTVHSMNPIGKENIESLLTSYARARLDRTV